MDLARLCLASGAVFGFLGVAAGAFGAHALKARLAPELLAVFETGARYQMYHALALLASASAASLAGCPPGPVRAAAWLFITGTLVFSGSLYILALSGVKAWGAVTPVGGLLLLGGWLSLAIAACKGVS